MTWCTDLLMKFVPGLQKRETMEKLIVIQNLFGEKRGVVNVRNGFSRN
jgi:hypothetical protein